MTSEDGLDSLDHQIAAMLEEQDPLIRVATLQRLSPLAGARLWPAIESMIESSSVEERLAAIVAVEQTRHFDLESRILSELASDDPRIAGAAAHAVSTLSNLRTQAMLLAMLGHLD